MIQRVSEKFYVTNKVVGITSTSSQYVTVEIDYYAKKYSITPLNGVFREFKFSNLDINNPNNINETCELIKEAHASAIRKIREHEKKVKDTLVEI